MIEKQHGGKRTGSGRPTADDKRRSRGFAASDTEWAQITELAKLHKVSVSEYLIRKALGTADENLNQNV